MAATTTTATKRNGINKLGSLIKDIGFAMLTTVCPDGSLRSRPMATQRDEFDGVLWFFTHAGDPKVREIQRDQRVNVSYADPAKNNYVSVSGRATLVRDKPIMKELWNPFYKAWFPKGLDDPQLALIRVAVEQAEYWDAPNSKLVQLGGFLKAVVTGKQARGGQNEKVTLRRPRNAAGAAGAAGVKSRGNARGGGVRSSSSSPRRSPARAARR
jgi:general stress protein 26